MQWCKPQCIFVFVAAVIAGAAVQHNVIVDFCNASTARNADAAAFCSIFAHGLPLNFAMHVGQSVIKINFNRLPCFAVGEDNKFDVVEVLIENGC